MIQTWIDVWQFMMLVASFAAIVAYGLRMREAHTRRVRIFYVIQMALFAYFAGVLIAILAHWIVWMPDGGYLLCASFTALIIGRVAQLLFEAP